MAVIICHRAASGPLLAGDFFAEDFFARDFLALVLVAWLPWIGSCADCWIFWCVYCFDPWNSGLIEPRRRGYIVHIETWLLSPFSTV
jgi:hypothetical protein